MDHKSYVVFKMKNTIETGILLILSILLLTNVASAAYTGWVAPSANSGGSGVSNPTYAYVDTTTYASFSNAGYWNWYGYALSSIPSGSTIDGIEVNAKGRESSSGCSSCYMRLRLSYDGGTTWTSYINTASSSWTTTISDHIAGGPANKWGREWTRDEIVNNLRVQAYWVGSSTSGRLTYLPVKIYYTEPVDITPPVITLSGSSSVTVEAGSVYTDAGATAQDNIDGNITLSIVTGGLPINTNILGTHTVTYDVNDSNGNVAIQVSRTVNVVDSTLPVITLSGSSPVTVEAGSAYTDAGATALDNYDGDLTSSIVTGGLPINTNILGAHTVTYDVTDSNGNAAIQVTRTVNVVDSTLPVITLSGSSPVTIEIGSLYTDSGATALDNIDGDITSFIVTVNPVNTAIIGTYTVTYNVKDSSNNNADQKTRTVNVVDLTPPEITLNGNNPEIVEVGSTYTDAGVTVTDNYDTGLLATMTGSVNTAVLGEYILTYNAVDSSGNAAIMKTRTVNVVDTTGPEITLNGNNPETVEAGSTYTDAGATVTDNYDTGLIPTMTGAVNTAVVGIYTLTYNAVDTSGNAAIMKTRTVNVVDTNTPIITLSGFTPVTVEAGSVYTDAGATAQDNIDGDLTSSIVTGGLPINTSELGAHTVTYDVTDSNGNAAIQATRTVNVVDTTSPVITLSGSNPVIVEAGSVYTDSGATAQDNIDGDITSSIVTGGLPVNTKVLGAHTVTYNVTDNSSNSAVQVTRTVNVVDTTSPVITLSGSNPVTVEAGFFVYTDAGATALDNYDGYLNSSIVTGGLPINTNILGPHTVTYDVADSNGNAAIRVTRTVFVTSTLPSVRQINGTVIDSAHTPLAGVTVSTTNGISSMTDGSGKYSLIVGQGSYPLTASYDIRYYTNRSVTVSTTGFTSVTQDIELVLKPTGNITGIVKSN